MSTSKTSRESAGSQGDNHFKEGVSIDSSLCLRPFFLIDSVVSDRKRVALGVALLFLGFIWAKSFGLFSKKAWTAGPTSCQLVAVSNSNASGVR